MGQNCTAPPLECGRKNCPLLEQDSEVVTHVVVEQQPIFEEYEYEPLFLEVHQLKPLFAEVYQHKPTVVEIYEPMPETASSSYADWLAENGLQSEAHENKPRGACTLVFTCLASVVFCIVAVRKLGQEFQQVWASIVWSMALLLWAIWYWHKSVLESAISYIAQVVKNLKPHNPAYADAYLFYDIGDSMEQRKFLTMNILILGSLGLLGLAYNSAGLWIHDLNVNQFHIEVSSIDHTMAFMATHPDYSCAVSGLTPLPHMYLLAKLTLGGFLQDLVIHKSKDLRANSSKPLSLFSRLFVVYQLATLMASVVSTSSTFTRQSSSATVWSIYQITAYKIFMGTGFTNVALLACKMLIETNVHEGHGSCISFDRLEWYRLPPFSFSLVKATKGTVFWVSSIILCIVGLPITCTHVISAFAYSLCAITFPLWGTLSLVLSFINSGSFAAIVLVGAQAHAQFWGIIGLLYLMVHVAMLLRELLWRVQCAVAGRRVYGKYGYAEGTMALFFAVPLVFIMQSCPIWADLAYGGCNLGHIPFTEFNLRIVQEYNSCFMSGSFYVQMMTRLALL